jgi:hypothetical protein
MERALKSALLQDGGVWFRMPEETAEIIQRQGLPLRIAEYRFLLLSGALSPSEHSDTLAKLVDATVALDNAQAYADAMASFGFMGEDSVVEGMRARNTAKLAKIEADIMDAKENLGEEVCCEARLRLKSVTIVKRVCA